MIKNEPEIASVIAYTASVLYSLEKAYGVRMPTHGDGEAYCADFIGREWRESTPHYHVALELCAKIERREWLNDNIPATAYPKR